MTKDDVYSVASGISALPVGTGVDSSGDVYILADTLQELMAQTPGPWIGAPGPSGVTVDEGSGAEVTFASAVGGACQPPYVGTGAGGYCTPSYATASLSYNSTTSQYTLVDHPYEVDVFNSVGALVSESTSGPAKLTLAYNSPTPGTGFCPTTATSCETITSASGRAIVLGLSSTGQVTTASDPSGNTWSYAYSSGNLTSVTDPMGRKTSYSYDTGNSNSVLVHDMLTVTSPNSQANGPTPGQILTNQYTYGQVTQQTDPMGRITQLSYNTNNATMVTDPDGFSTEYNSQNLYLTSKFAGYGSSEPSDTFNIVSPSTGQLNETVDPDGGVTSYQYDAVGNVTSTTDPMGHVTTASYNSFDEVTCSTLPLAAAPCSTLTPPAAAVAGTTVTPPSAIPPAYVTYHEYDTNGNQLWQTTGIYHAGAATSARTTYALFPGNSLTIGTTTTGCAAVPPTTALPCATIDADAGSHVTQLSYDPAGDLASSSIPDGNVVGGQNELATTSYLYNANGDQVSTTSPLGNLAGAKSANFTTTTTYNADDQPLVSDGCGKCRRNGDRTSDCELLRLQWQPCSDDSAARKRLYGNPHVGL